ncbi:AsmA family protein [Tistrella mobilis]
MVKKILIAAAVLVVVLVGAAVAAPFLIPTGAIVQRVTAEVEARTGRKLVIEGDVGLDLLPDLAVRVDGARFANAPWSDAGDMARIGQLQVELALWPLLSGDVQVRRFVLEEPVIRLERNADGAANWQINAGGQTSSGTLTPAAPPTTGPAPAAPAGTSSSGGGLSGLSLGEVKIANGTVVYTDAVTGTDERLDDVNLTIAAPDLDSRLTLAGDARWRDQALTVSAEAGQARAVLEGGQTPVSLDLALGEGKIHLAGDAVLGTSPGFTGTAGLSLPDLRSIIAAAAPGPALPEGVATRLNLDGRIDATAARIALTDMKLGIDDIEATGSLSADMSGARPKIKAGLTTGDLVLDRYLAGRAAAGDGATGPEGTARSGAGWSDEPIDLSALGLLDADVTLNATSVSLGDTKLGATELRLALDGRRARIEVPKTALYGGSGSATIGLDGRATPASMSVKATFSGLDMLPLLKASADFDRLEGKGRLEADLTARGNSQRALIGSLGGKGLFEFTDGAIRGINIAALIRDPASALRGETTDVRKTDFARLAGTYTIDKGILTNRDAEMQAPLLRVGGQGRVDLPARRVDYRIEPKAVANLEGQGGQTGLAGVLVPVLVQGPWDNLSFRPDLEGTVKRTLEDPDAARKTLDDVRSGNFGDALKGLLGR